MALFTFGCFHFDTDLRGCSDTDHEREGDLLCLIVSKLGLILQSFQLNSKWTSAVFVHEKRAKKWMNARLFSLTFTLIINMMMSVRNESSEYQL